jgi:hypothetical protein
MGDHRTSRAVAGYGVTFEDLSPWTFEQKQVGNLSKLRTEAAAFPSCLRQELAENGLLSQRRAAGFQRV